MAKSYVEIFIPQLGHVQYVVCCTAHFGPYSIGRKHPTVAHFTAVLSTNMHVINIFQVSSLVAAPSTTNTPIDTHVTSRPVCVVTAHVILYYVQDTVLYLPDKYHQHCSKSIAVGSQDDSLTHCCIKISQKGEATVVFFSV